MALASSERWSTLRTTDDGMNGPPPTETDAQLLDLLGELVRAEGRRQAAHGLGVNYRTLVRAVESGRLTGRMRDALERWRLADREATATRQRDAVQALAQRIAELDARLTAVARERRGPGDGGGDRRALARRLDADARAVEALTRRVARLERDQGPPTAAQAHERGWRPPADGPVDPGVVTKDPHPGEEASYGPGMPLVAEWRRLTRQREDGTKLDQVKTRERIMALEIALIEEYELTLPPDTDPLHPSQREGYLRWRRRALADLQTERVRRELLRWVRRVLTVGLWWR